MGGALTLGKKKINENKFTYIFKNRSLIMMHFSNYIAYATKATISGKPIQAAVPCYGTPPADAFDVTKITDATAVQGHFGGQVRYIYLLFILTMI